MISPVIKIIEIINMREDCPLQIIPGYSNKKRPDDPFSAYYELQPKLDDVYAGTEENGVETAITHGEFPVQFDVFGSSIAEAREKAYKLWELIVYKMRYEDWSYGGIGIIGQTAPKAAHYQIDSKSDNFNYRFTFDITFESDLKASKLVSYIEEIQITVNSKTFTVKEAKNGLSKSCSN